MPTVSDTHVDMVARLSKSGADIARHLSKNPELAHLWHMASCIQGEAGELFDAVKKLSIYAQEPDDAAVENMVEELGDIEFYLEGFRQGLNRLLRVRSGRIVTRNMTLLDNIVKLEKRYPSGYTDQSAKERKDKS